MDFWNRQKVKELERAIAEQKKEITEKDRTNKRLKSDVDTLNKEVDKLVRKIRGDRVCDGCCKWCAHSIVVTEETQWGTNNIWYCELDCKCKDFQRKDAES